MLQRASYYYNINIDSMFRTAYVKMNRATLLVKWSVCYVMQSVEQILNDASIFWMCYKLSINARRSIVGT